MTLGQPLRLIRILGLFPDPFSPRNCKTPRMRTRASSFRLLRKFLVCFGCVAVLWLFGSQAVAAEAAKAGDATSSQIVHLKVFPESLELG